MKSLNCYLLITCLFIAGLVLPVAAFDSVIDPKESTTGIGFESGNIVESNQNHGFFGSEEYSALVETPVNKAQVSKVSFTITLSAVPASVTTGPDMLVGYVSSQKNNLEVVITGRESLSSDFKEVGTTKTDDNGMFVWIVPESARGMVRYAASAAGSTGSAVSNAVTFESNDNSANMAMNIDTVPVQPVKTAATPVASVSSTSKRSDVSSPLPTQLTLRVSTTTPYVGDEVTLSGRLTDSSGVGVAKASIVVGEDDGYGFGSLNTVRTDSNGNYESTITTMFADSVPLQARFEGNNEYLPSNSMSVFIRAVNK